MGTRRTPPPATIARLGPQGKQGRAGFTLIELLVVIAIIGLLLGIILSGLLGARKTSQRSISLSNLRQITAGAFMYAFDNNDRLPITPSNDYPEVFTYPLFNSFSYGGKTTSSFWGSRRSGLNFHGVEERPLNPYLYDAGLLHDQGFATVPENPGDFGSSFQLARPDDDDRIELEIYRSPGDIGTYQRGFWGNPVYNTTISSYDDVGTSYHANVKWFYDCATSGNGSVSIAAARECWDKFKNIMRISSMIAPSQYVWNHDQVFDFIANTGNSREGEFGEMNRSVAAFLDGRADYVFVEPGELETREYRLTLLPQGF